MPSPPRLLLPDYPVLVTTRVEVGLPFVCKEFINLLQRSVLATAAAKYNATICHFLGMGNHPHFLAVTKNAEDFTAFMDYYKTESAHRINRLLGRRQRTLWAASYDAVPILTLEDVIEKIVYIYCNPQRAALVNKIEQYPGFSSWQMFSSGEHSFKAPYIPRTAFVPLSSLNPSPKEDAALCKRLLSKGKDVHTFTLRPNAWMPLFGIDENSQEAKEINERIVQRIRVREQELREERHRAGKRVLGPEALKAQGINLTFEPQSFGRRMYCICHEVEKRVSFIAMVKEMLRKAREVKERWLVNDFSVPFPLGLLPPRHPLLLFPLRGAFSLG